MRLESAGEFAGVAVVGVELAYFRHAYDSIISLRNRSFLFLRKDGTILVRYPDDEARLLDRMPAGSPWHQLVAGGGGPFETPGVVDGVERLVAVRPLPDYPLVVNVGVTKADALATWRRRATLIGAGVLLAVCCLGLLLRQLAKQFRRLLQSEFS